MRAVSLTAAENQTLPERYVSDQRDAPHAGAVVGNEANVVSKCVHAREARKGCAGVAALSFSLHSAGDGATVGDSRR